MKTATLKFAGTQEGYGTLPAIDLYNIVALSEPHDKLVVNSTVSVKSVRALGYVPMFTVIKVVDNETTATNARQ